MISLSTHVLDTAAGLPAKRLMISLRRIEPQSSELGEFTTNDDGRINGPLLSETDAIPGVYELTFHAGDYLRAQGYSLTEFPFLDVVPIRFGMSKDGHYHVPLLLSPFGYSTYRGS
jgi:5-hydroxyisourate hydrolase